VRQELKTQGQINELLNKLPLILLCTIRIDNSLFDCHVLPQQGRNRATGLGTWVGAQPLWYQCGMDGVFPKGQQQAKYVASDILTTVGIASIGLLQPIIGSKAAHNGGWVRLLLNKLIQGYLRTVNGLNAVSLDRCPVHAVFTNLVLYGPYA
jgi:hypothetical protein